MNVLDTRHNTTLKGKLEHRQGALAPGSPSAVTVQALYVGISHHGEMCNIGRKKNATLVTRASVPPCSTENQDRTSVSLRKGGARHLSCSSAAAPHPQQAAHGTRVHSWNSSCKSLTDDTAAKQRWPWLRNCFHIWSPKFLSAGR